MSCVLSNIGCFEDISTVRKFLFPNNKPADTADLDGWDDADWSWNQDDEEEGETSEGKKDEQEAWLQECSMSLSPTGDLMVLAFEEKVVFLQQKWDPRDEDGIDYRYHVIYKGALNQDDGECVTSVLCIPLASQKRSSQGAPDWTCVVVGFTTGYVRMYTETGALLLSQLLHEDPILKLKCRTYEIPRYPGIAEQQEELTILYPNSLVTIDGFSLFQSLRACRNQLARAAASGTDQIQPPPLAYKKWGLVRQDATTDHVSCGMVTPCAFDQLNADSVVNGYTASIKATPPAASRYVTTGVGPYVGFFYALEGSSQPLLSDVAMAMASKLKSAFLSAASGWFGIGSGRQSTDEQPGVSRHRPKVEPATSLPIRFGLPDLRRSGDSLLLSPGTHLAVSTDSFGRVVLIDLARGIAVRMWKGYRDAQCGWVSVTEDLLRDKSDPAASKAQRQRTRQFGARVALFLVIYAPRRGILEIWNTQQGPRVAAFNVPKSCQLLCPGYSTMGLNSLSLQDSRARPHTLQCCLVQSDGLVRTISVPFHLALSDRNSKRAHDLHLVKKLSGLLHHRATLKEPLDEAITAVLVDIKISSYKQQALEKVLLARGMSPLVLLRIVRSLSTHLRAHGADCLDYEGQCLLRYCSLQEELLQVYTKLQGMHSIQEKSGPSDETSTKELATALDIPSEDISTWHRQILTYLDVAHHTKVHFASDYQMEASAFVGCFQSFVEHQGSKRAGQDGGGGGEIEEGEEEDGASRGDELRMRLKLKASLTEEYSVKLGLFLYGACLRGDCPAGDLCAIIKKMEIPSEELTILLFKVWLQNEQDLLRPVSHTVNLHRLLVALFEHNGQNRERTCWKEVQSLLSQSERVGAGLMAAVVARQVAMDTSSQSEKESLETMETNKADPQGMTSQDPGDSPMDVDTPSAEWVDVTLDRQVWDQLARRLEDVVSLSCLVHAKPSKGSFTNSEKAHSKAWSATQDSGVIFSDAQPTQVSITKILEGGKGIIAEYVARWVAQNGVPPSFLSNCSGSNHAIAGVSSEGLSLGDDAQQVQELLQALCLRFPRSLAHDIMQAHCTWEYIVRWNKNPEVTDLFKSALGHLQTIRNPLLQHGIASMMWHTFSVKKVSATAFLIDKIGKAPKDRLCRKDVGMSDVSLESFIGLCCELLDMIYVVETESSLVPSLEMEELWQDVQGPTPLAELAISQPLPNHYMVDLHKQLTTSLHAILVFNTKSIKPLKVLFDYKARNAFFRDLDAPVMQPTGEVDQGLQRNRDQFMMRIITDAVESLPPNHSMDPKQAEPICHSPPVMPSSPGPLDVRRIRRSHPAHTWPGTVVQLAIAFGGDVDRLKRHHVCELFKSGYDAIAQEVLVTVTDHTQMAVQLINVIGLRLAQVFIVDANAASVARQSSLPASLITWLKVLAKESSLRCPHPPIPDTAHLVSKAVGLLPERHPQYALGLQLVEAVGSLT
ncbi:rab3 GTPase-activating protein non-catalytic subunit-like isoform X2 [Patiria miniata]|uniref:Rab3 GTPase-activating protein non-catalytic subunit n=1 Tax=Patiria miniata TaxID=46514 RepID=A0A914BP84_PATMI|nr:rab3 GTPase-activating protein non-catalytic subunit-like isoform X2 [Patiria miniata]